MNFLLIVSRLFYQIVTLCQTYNFLLIPFICYVFQIFTSAQPYDFSSFSYMISYIFKCLFCTKPMFFLLVSLTYNGFQNFTSDQPYDFFLFPL